jgi:hypothetical protein
MAFTITKATKLQIEVASVLTTIAHVETITPPQAVLTTIRAKGLTDDFSTVLVAGDVEGGQASAALFHDPLDVQHQLLAKTVHSTDFTETGFKPVDRKKNWCVKLDQLAVPKSWLFNGPPVQYNVSIGLSDVLKAALTIEVERTTALPV